MRRVIKEALFLTDTLSLCQILSKILPSTSIQYVEETTGDHQNGFRR